MKLNVGDKASISRSFTAKDVKTFAQVSLDHNPLHEESQLANESMFGEPIVHGQLVAALISALLGEKLPGPGTIYLSQTLKFVAPVFIGDAVTAEAIVVQIREKNGIVKLTTRCFKNDETLVIEGDALVMHPSLKEK
jgi:3-hydroxybutyryl-CoA dehydratase